MTFLRYVVIQGFAYVIDMGSFLFILHLGVAQPIVANIFAKLAAGAFAFFAHRRYTFRHGGSGVFFRRQAMLYFLLLVANVPIASAILAVILIWLPIPVAAKFLSDILSVALSYGFTKHFIFKTQTDSASARI